MPQPEPHGKCHLHCFRRNQLHSHQHAKRLTASNPLQSRLIRLSFDEGSFLLSGETPVPANQNG